MEDASVPGGIVAGMREFRGLGCRAVGSQIRTVTWPVFFRQPAMAGAAFFVMNHTKIGSEQKKRIPPFGGTLDQKRLSCTISGIGASAGSPAFCR